MKARTVFARFGNERGVALASVIMVLLVVSVFSVMVLYVASSDVRLNIIDEHNSEDYYIAWSAANVVADEIRKAAENNTDNLNELLVKEEDNKYIPKTGETYTHDVEFVADGAPYNAKVSVKKTKQANGGTENVILIESNYNNAKSYVSMRIDVQKAQTAGGRGSGFVVQSGGWYNHGFGNALGAHVTKGETNLTTDFSYDHGVTVVGAVYATDYLNKHKNGTFELIWPTDENEIPYTEELDLKGKRKTLKLPENYSDPTFNVLPSTIIGDGDFAQVVNGIRKWVEQKKSLSDIENLVTQKTGGSYFNGTDYKNVGIDAKWEYNGPAITAIFKNHPQLIKDIVSEMEDIKEAGGIEKLETHRENSIAEDDKISKKTDEEKDKYVREYASLNLKVPRLKVVVPKNTSRLNPLSPSEYKPVVAYTYEGEIDETTGSAKVLNGIRVYVNLMRYASDETGKMDFSHNCLDTNCTVINPCANYYTISEFDIDKDRRKVFNFEKIVQDILDSPGPASDPKLSGKNIASYDEISIIFSNEFMYNNNDNGWYSIKERKHAEGADYFVANSKVSTYAVDTPMEIFQQGTVSVPSGKDLNIVFDHIGGSFSWLGTPGSLYKNADDSSNEFSSVSFLINQIKTTPPEGETYLTTSDDAKNPVNFVPPNFSGDVTTQMQPQPDARLNFKMTASQTAKTHMNCPIHIYAPDGSIISNSVAMNSIFYGSIYCKFVGLKNLVLSYIPAKSNPFLIDSDAALKGYEAGDIEMRWVSGGDFYE
jgi:hypothetical protein